MRTLRSLTLTLLAACGPAPSQPDPEVDAGGLFDGGTTQGDSGTALLDASVRDAGFTDARGDAGLDAGPLDAGADAGSTIADGGLPLDAGVDGGLTIDAGVTLDAGATTDAGTALDAGCLVVSFDGIPDGGAWPSGWTIAGGVSALSISGGAGSWAPVLSTQPYSLGRLTHPGCGAVDVEVQFSAWLPPSTGLGFYVRSNGGFLAPRATTAGAGYALFLETFRDRRFGLWRERTGVEFELLPVLGVTPSSTWVRARFQVRQLPLADGGSSTSATQLRGRVWTPPASEPTSWAEIIDSSPELQAGASSARIAIDAFTDAIPGRDAGVAVLIDDIEIVRLR